MTSKQQAVRSLISVIEKQYGKGAIMNLGEGSAEKDVPILRTGSLALDRALGIGGYPRGRIIEIYGPESSGKTTLALHALRECQRGSGVAAFIDAEHAFDPKYARNIGVDTDRLLISQPDNGEQALEIVDVLTRSGAVDVIVIDSVAALVPKAELEGDMGDPHMGLQARLMSQALRKLTATASRTGTLIIFINQLRHKIGVVFGSPETTTGGNALKFYASVRLDVRRAGALKIGEETVGAKTRVKVVKNKLATPFKEAEFDIRWGTGIDAAGDLVDIALAFKVLQQNGGYISFQGEVVGHGRERAREAIKGPMGATVRAAVETAMKQPIAAE
jgi:recombination protein RecA